MNRNVGIFIACICTFVLALVSTYPLVFPMSNFEELNNKDLMYWEIVAGYVIILIILWSVYFTLFFFFGLILNKSKLKIDYGAILKAFKISIGLVAFVVGLGIIKNAIEYDEWNKKVILSSKKIEEEKKDKFLEEVKFLNGKILSEPKNSDNYFLLGTKLRRNEDFDESIRYYKMAIEIDSEISDYHLGLAYSLRSLKQYELALREFELAYKLDSTKTRLIEDINLLKSY